jgi:hypothetical protein
MAALPTYKAGAIGIFRGSVFFVFAIAAFAERDQHTSTILAAAVFLLDVASWHICTVSGVGTESLYDRLWFNTLTNRFTFEKILDRFRDGEHIDFEAITKESSVAERCNGALCRTGCFSEANSDLRC